MTKSKLLFFIPLVALFCSGCYPTSKMPQVMNYYGPALYQNDIAYIPKPLSSDQKHTANYLSASLWESSGADPNNSNDEITRGELNFGQGFTTKYLNIGYNVFGAAGTYSNETNTMENDPYYFSNKFFGAAGGRFSINGYFTSGRVDIRFLGFEMAYSHEFGAYTDYRQMVTNQNLFYTNNRTNLVTLGGSSEVTWHSSDPDIHFGFRVFLGQSLNDNYYKNQGVVSPYYSGQYIYTTSLAYFMQIHRYFFVGEISSIGGQLRLGYRF